MTMAKFYKGPWHGKKRIVNGHTHIVLETPKLNWADMLNSVSPDPLTPLSLREGMYVKTHHTHPDGSTFYEWKGWS